MTDFSFLDNVEVVEVLPSSMGRSRTKAEPNPTNADLRLFADGSLYPSKALTEEFSLEYQNDDTAVVERGFDLINSTEWGMLPKGTPQFLAIATVGKNEAPKPMLFGKSRKVEGKPTHSVNDQGSTASGKTLLEYLEATGNKVATEAAFTAEGYLDLIIIRDHKIQASNGIYNLPRKVKKGNNEGNLTSVRRENCDIYPLAIVVVAAEESVEAVIDLEEDSFSEQEVDASYEENASPEEQIEIN